MGIDPVSLSIIIGTTIAVASLAVSATMYFTMSKSKPTSGNTAKLEVTRSEEGVTIPKIFGIVCLCGNLDWYDYFYGKVKQNHTHMRTLIVSFREILCSNKAILKSVLENKTKPVYGSRNRNTYHYGTIFFYNTVTKSIFQRLGTRYGRTGDNIMPNGDMQCPGCCWALITYLILEPGLGIIPTLNFTLEADWRDKYPAYANTHEQVNEYGENPLILAIDVFNTFDIVIDRTSFLDCTQALREYKIGFNYAITEQTNAQDILKLLSDKCQLIFYTTMGKYYVVPLFVDKVSTYFLEKRLVNDYQITESNKYLENYSFSYGRYGIENKSKTFKISADNELYVVDFVGFREIPQVLSNYMMTKNKRNLKNLNITVLKNYAEYIEIGDIIAFDKTPGIKYIVTSKIYEIKTKTIKLEAEQVISSYTIYDGENGGESEYEEKDISFYSPTDFIALMINYKIFFYPVPDVRACLYEYQILLNNEYYNGSSYAISCSLLSQLGETPYFNSATDIVVQLNRQDFDFENAIAYYYDLFNHFNYLLFSNEIIRIGNVEFDNESTMRIKTSFRKKIINHTVGEQCLLLTEASSEIQESSLLNTNHIKFLPFFGENSIDEDLATDFTYFHTKSKITLITHISGANITFVFCLPGNNGAGMKNCSFLPIYGVAELGENEYIYINGTKYQENIVSIPLSGANTFNVTYIKNGVGRSSEIQKIQGFWEL